MSHLRSFLSRSTFPLLLVACLAALSFSYAFADSSRRPLAVAVIGDPDAAVNGKFAVGSSSVGSKALTVTGVIDFLGAGTVHNYFTQGAGNNMQINTNVDEANTVGDASKSQWKLVLGSSLDWFSIRRSPAGGTYNEDALFFIQGSTGNVGIATVDTGNGATIPFTPQARLDVEATSGHAIRGVTTASSGSAYGVSGQSDSTTGRGVFGSATATTGTNFGVYGGTMSGSGYGVYGYALATDGANYGVYGASNSSAGIGTYGYASATAGLTYGVFGESGSTSGRGVMGWAAAGSGSAYGVSGQSDSTDGTGVFALETASTGYTFGMWAQADSSDGTGIQAYASATTGTTYGVYGQSASPAGYGVYGVASASTGTNYGVYGRSVSTSGTGVYGIAVASSGTNYGVYGRNNSSGGRGVVGYATATTGSNLGVLGLSDSPSGMGVYGIGNASSGVNYGVYGQSNSASGYGVYFVGGLAGTGTKSAIVDTKDYGWRSLYAVESPQNWFEDFGQATLTAGEAVVKIEPIYSQTVNLDKPYHVFLTPQGGYCSLYVAETSTSAFTVRAAEGDSCEIAFDYRIIAPRLDYEDLRLKPSEDPQEVAASMPPAP
jgi:hypothetical protein